MNLPKKIYPDNIKDSIVEIRYTSELPFEITLGFFFKALDDSYIYMNRQMSQFLLPNGTSVDFAQGSVNLFHNEVIKFEIRPNSIVFNCIDQYRGWEVFEENIKKTITQLLKSEAITSFERVGVRYISEYQNEELTAITKFKFSFGFPEIKSNSYSFRCDFEKDGKRIALNLNNNVQVSQQLSNIQNVDLSKTSFIDVDIINDNINSDNFETLMTIINDCHNEEKIIFFGLLDDNYYLNLKKEF